MDISDEVRDYCDDLNVEPVSSRAFGSRMMNLNGPDSDYDILVVFKRPAWQHVSPRSRSETYERSSGERDYQFWDVSKLLSLASESNPTAVEFLNSPKVYLEPDEYAEPMRAARGHLNQTFTPISLYYHYANMAIDNYEKYVEQSIHFDGYRMPVVDETESAWICNDSGDRVEVLKDTVYEESTLDRTVKRNLYIARAVLYARHVLETHAVPSMNLPQFVNSMIDGDLGVDIETIREIRSLVTKKRCGQGYDECGNVVGGLVETEKSREPDAEEHAVGSPDDRVLDSITEELHNA